MTTDATRSAASEDFHYYDRHPTPKDLMGESAAQDRLLAYLFQIFSWMLRDTPTFVSRNLNIYTERKVGQMPIEPDLALFAESELSDETLRSMRSWRLYEPERPPPYFVVEVASKETWRQDLEHKPALYDALGVQEYVLYDPNIPQYIPGSKLRLWRRINGALQLVPLEPDGRVWSETTASWLVPNRGMLRLTNAAGVRRLTEGEAERRRANIERKRAETERTARERAQAQVETERAAAEVAQRQAEAERAAKEQAWAKLRALGIDPETL